jgi:Glycosyl hydrolase family 76
VRASSSSRSKKSEWQCHGRGDLCRVPFLVTTFRAFRAAGISAISAAFIVLLAVCLVGTAVADQTVTLGAREFGAKSPAAPMREAFNAARRRAAATTPAWATSTEDLSAWGPALVFPLLGSGLPNDTVLALAAQLEPNATAPELIWRTVGLYAAKSRVPFDDTPKLRAAVRRNLKAINRAAHDINTFAEARELKGWGPAGLGAWVAYLDLLFRDYFELGRPGADPWNADGLKIVNDLLARARLPDGKGFRAGPRNDELRLWPNALMLYALTKAYENEELVKYEDAAVALVESLDVLRDHSGAYFSDVAKTDMDARANAYLAGGLLRLAKDTGDAAYQERALGVLRWLTRGPGAATLAQTAALETHVGYLILLADSLATQPMENILDRRPMRISTAPATPLPVGDLRPADFRYKDMFDGVLETLSNHLPRQDGDFAYDYGDSPGYAAEVLLSAHQDDVAREVLGREQTLLSWPRPRNLEEMSFGARGFFAVLDRPEAFPHDGAEAALRRYVLFSGVLAMADRYYMDTIDWLTGGGGYGYGPTVIGAQIADSQLTFARVFPDDRVGWLIDPATVGRQLVDTAGTQAWDEPRHVYRVRPGDDNVWLLPNAMMVLALLKVHDMTGDAAYLARAEAVTQGLEPLWDAKHGAYFASSTQTGPDGYLSLSTNSYTALAFYRLAIATSKQPYRERAQSILDFIQRDLYSDGVVYHHFYRGRRAAGDIWCSGCNWRVLSVLREVAQENGGLPAAPEHTHSIVDKSIADSR